MTAAIKTDPSGANTGGEQFSPMGGPTRRAAVLDGEIDEAIAPLVTATVITSSGLSGDQSGIVFDLTYVGFCDPEGPVPLVVANDHPRSDPTSR